jgi:pyruvate dehydrogenase E2 component (dihydrolipoyllysine-residue acetyltransferase)
VHRRGGGACRRQQDGGLVNLKAFFVATLQSALDLGIATPDDVIRHVTPDVLAVNLPRPLWARLLTACVGAPRVDAQLVVETIGVPNLCEHVPAPIIWSCIEELAQRALDGAPIAIPAPAPAPAPAQAQAAIARPQAAAAAPAARPVPLATPPPPPAAEPKVAAPAPVAVGPSIPAPGAPATEPDLDSAGRARAVPGQRFRQSNTGMGRLAPTPTSRRPQAQATPTAAPPVPAAEAPPERDRGGGLPRIKRGQTEADFDLETFVGGKDDWKSALAVEDEQLVDWSASEETASSADEIGRKR